MNDITIWKLCVDVGLVLSLLFMCYRFGRSTGLSAKLGRIANLDTSLKTALREAEQSSRTLSEELKTRKRSLEQLLFDIESVESRVNQALDAAEDARKKLRRDADHAIKAAPAQRPAQNTSSFEIEKEVVPSESSRRQQAYRSPSASVQREKYVNTPEPASFERPNASTTPHTTPHTTSRSTARRQATNIYGQPIPLPSEDVSSTHQPRSLAQHVQKEIAKEEQHSAVQNSLEDIYASAEELLRAGKNLEQVATQTKLPVDELRMLSQIISQEDTANEEVTEISSIDERLGVLAGIKRERQVL